MRIIPKRTKVRMELFKGIELVDVLVAGAGMGISASFLVSNLPGNLVLSVIALLITVGLVVPIEDDKGYILLFNVLKYLGRYRVFYKRSALQEKRSRHRNRQRSRPLAGKRSSLLAAAEGRGLRACRGYLWRISRPLRELTAITLSMAPPTVRWS